MLCLRMQTRHSYGLGLIPCMAAGSAPTRLLAQARRQGSCCTLMSRIRLGIGSFSRALAARLECSCGALSDVGMRRCSVWGELVNAGLVQRGRHHSAAGIAQRIRVVQRDAVGHAMHVTASAVGQEQQRGNHTNSYMADMVEAYASQNDVVASCSRQSDSVPVNSPRHTRHETTLTRSPLGSPGVLTQQTMIQHTRTHGRRS